MKALALKKFGQSDQAFELMDFPTPAPGPGEAKIKVSTFGLNYADVMARNGLYKACPPLPAILGYEVVGTVEEVGAEEDQSWVGKCVVAMTRFGGYAQYAITKVGALAEVPENVSDAQGTALATQYVTAYYAAYKCLNLSPGDQVMLHAAAGGVGTALIQLCKLKDCEVIAMAGSDEKAAFAISQGADHAINYRNTDYPTEVRRILGKETLDIAFNSVAGATVKKDMALLGAGGKLVVYGAADRSGKKWGKLSTLNMVRKMGIIPPVGLMIASRGIIGVNMLAMGDEKPHVVQACLRGVMDLAKEGKINPQVGGEFKASELAEAHGKLENRSTIGKIAVHWN